MSDYSSTFTKSAGQVIEDTDFKTEFAAIETHIATKADTDGDTLTNLTIGSGYAGGAVTRDIATATPAFTGIGSYVKKITIAVQNLGVSGAAYWYLKIGDSGGLESTGYGYNVITFDGAGSVSQSKNSGAASLWPLTGTVASTGRQTGEITLTNLSGNIWTISSNIGDMVDGVHSIVSGVKTLSATLDRLTIAVSAGAINNGTVNLVYEG